MGTGAVTYESGVATHKASSWSLVAATAPVTWV